MSAIRVIPFVAAALLAACASDGSDKTYYGYEDEYVLPEPDMVPDVPDDKPGKTVDELVRDGVTVNRARDTADDGSVYEREGRFGSKEKIALRRGLNAPSAEANYGDKTRAPETDVRPLDVRESIARDDLVFKSEQEMLEAVIKPRQSKVVPVEVVGLDIDKKPVDEKPAADEKPLVGEHAPAPADAEIVLVEPPAEDEGEHEDGEEEIVLKEPAEGEEFEDEEEEIRLVMPPEQPEDEEFAEEAPIVLRMPAEEISEETAVRIAPAKKKNAASKRSIGLIRFSGKSALLPLTAGETVTDAAQLYEFEPEGRVLVVGYDAPNGSKSRAIKRAAAVSSALVAAGVPADKISRRAVLAAPEGETVGSHAEIFLIKGGVIK